MVEMKTEARRRLAVYILSFAIGAIIMSFEMLASRFLYPYFGSGINTWGAIISLVLLALMAGYFFGGYLSDRWPRPRVLGYLVLSSSLIFFTIPLWNDALMSWVMMNVGDGAFGTMVAASVLLLLPLVQLGAASPFCIRLLIKDRESAGRVSGIVYSASTFGSIVGTLGTTFYLMPIMGSRDITLVIGVASLICAAGLIFGFRGRG